MRRSVLDDHKLRILAQQLLRVMYDRKVMVQPYQYTCVNGRFPPGWHEGWRSWRAGDAIHLAALGERASFTSGFSAWLGVYALKRGIVVHVWADNDEVIVEYRPSTTSRSYVMSAVQGTLSSGVAKAGPISVSARYVNGGPRVCLEADVGSGGLSAQRSGTGRPVIDWVQQAT